MSPATPTAQTISLRSKAGVSFGVTAAYTSPVRTSFASARSTRCISGSERAIAIAVAGESTGPEGLTVRVVVESGGVDVVLERSAVAHAASARLATANPTTT